MLTEIEVKFFNWATKVPSPLPKNVTWEEFPRWLESNPQTEVFASAMEDLLEEFPEDFPPEDKVSKKAILAWEKSCQTYVSTPEDDAAWIDAYNNLLPYWQKVYEEVNVGVKGNPEFKSTFLGWECRAPKEEIEKAEGLWRKTSAFGAFSCNPFCLRSEQPQVIALVVAYTTK